MYSPKVDVLKDMDDDPTSILRVFGDFKSRVGSSLGGNTIAESRSISSSSMGGIRSASQRLR